MVWCIDVCPWTAYKGMASLRDNGGKKPLQHHYHATLWPPLLGA
jgi:hypothetical protein